jgi:transcriptional regulator with XRE-family HTH domain
MGIYERYAEARDSKGLTDSDVAKNTGVARSTLSEWKRGRSTPKIDKLERIADFLEMPLEYLKTGSLTDKNGYFLDEEAAKIAQELHDNHDLRIIFDATRKASKEDLEFIKDMINRMGLND